MTPDHLAALVAESGLRRIHLVSWRDLDDDEAGGSEVHASNVAMRWAAAGLDVHLRTSFAVGRPATAVRDGVRVTRRAGRYAVFPRAAVSEALRRTGRWDAFVEIWNGMPFFSPLWTVGKPSTTWLHHMHADMWHQTFADQPRVGAFGHALETRIAPKLYRRTRIVTLSASSKDELVREMGFRPALEALRRELGADAWLRLPGWLGDAEIVDLYRRAWVLASTSLREGWHMGITEAAACGTPAVVTDIAGHRDAVDHGRSGLLAADERGLVDGIDAVLRDRALRARLAEGALAHARRFTWDATAFGTFRALAEEAARRR